MNPIYSRLTLNRTVPIPLYYQIKTFFIEHIQAGTLADGEAVPPEEELCALWDVSRPTVRQAFSDLVHEGYLNRLRSRGTHITRPKVNSDFIQKIQNYNQETERMGLVPSTKVLSLERQSAMEEVAEHLSLPPKASVLRLERLRFANGQPMVYVKTFLPSSPYADILEAADLEKESLYQTLEMHCNVRIGKLTRQIHAALADDYLARLLRMIPGSAILYISTVAYTEGGIPFEYSLASYRGDSYRMNVELCSRNGPF
ncbi:MAG: GntR family transcriptional regulator [Lachnospiraceae bacterium]|nr:GntR family transcriptional regulator [Lachnospiraceae bacterium]